ncbi:MAG: class IIb bacteriocin, lactobin A/cerein 7B family [Cyclobacteriaceae bacterium]
MENVMKFGELRELDNKELISINGGVDPFTVGLVIGGLIALYRWLHNK